MDAESYVTSSVEELSPVSKRINVSIQASHVEQEVQAALSKAAQTATIKGFRPGKAPRQMVEMVHGPRIRLEVTDRLISSSLNNIVKKNELDVLGSPELEIESVEPGKNLEFRATVALFPKPDVKNYDSFSVKVEKRQATDSEVDEQIERLRVSKATVRPITGRTTSHKGDVAKLSLQIAIEGQPPARPEPAVIVLGEGRLPSEVEDALLGCEVGQERVVESKIPDTYRDPDLRGKPATYKMTLESLSERLLPEVDDAFARSVSEQLGTLLELRLKVRESLEQEYERQARVDAESAVLDQLVAANQFEVPQPLVDDEIRSLLVRMGAVDQRKTDVRQISVEPLRAELQDSALKRVQTAILVDRIGQIENLMATEDELRERVRELASSSQVSEEEVTKFLAKEGRLVNLMLELTRTKVIAFLMKRTSVAYEPKS